MEAKRIAEKRSRGGNECLNRLRNPFPDLTNFFLLFIGSI